MKKKLDSYVPVLVMIAGLAIVALSFGAVLLREFGVGCPPDGRHLLQAVNQPVVFENVGIDRLDILVIDNERHCLRVPFVSCVRSVSDPVEMRSGAVWNATEECSQPFYVARLSRPELAGFERTILLPGPPDAEGRGTYATVRRTALAPRARNMPRCPTVPPVP